MASFPDTCPRPSRLTRRLILSGPLLLWVLLAVSHAQITLDGSLGPPGPLAGPHSRIGAELGQIRGGNLFHSFEQFNVPTGGSATFTGPATIANILSRVTGGQPSAIDGRLRSEIAGAHLYLLNPSGVLFGPNASLEVSGSFHVSTADVLRFTDEAAFSTHLGQASMLTVAEPTAFGFLGSNPAPVTIQGSTLLVPAGKALSVVGGDIEIVGRGPLTADSSLTLGAPRGRLQLASVASPGDVRFSPLELAPDLQVDSFAQLGRIALSRGAVVDASGNGGGVVLLRGGRLFVDHAWMFADNLGHVDGTGLGLDLWVAADAVVANGSGLTTDSFGAGRARDLRLTAGHLHLEDALIGSLAFGIGNSGHVMVQVGTLTVTDGAQISSATFGRGHGGAVTVTATDAITIAGQSQEGAPSGLFSSVLVFPGFKSSAFGSGEGGRLFISAPTVRLEGGAISTSTEAGSRAGDIVIQAGQLSLTGGAQIDSRSSAGGPVGTVTVTATEAITIAGRDPQRTLPSGLFSADLGSSGVPGTLVITTPHLRMDEGALIGGSPGALDVVAGATQGRVTVLRGASALNGRAADLAITAGTVTLTGGAAIISSTPNVHPGGRITITADQVLLTEGARLESTSGLLGEAGAVVAGAGRGGDLTIEAREIQLADGAVISATSLGSGDAGTLRLTARDTFESTRSTVTTAATQASGGNIEVRAGSRVQLRDSQLSASVRGGPETVGGNLTIGAPFVIAESSQIVATAVAGQGGNIGIGAEVLLADPASLIDASSAVGLSGTVAIQAPVTSLSGTLAPLPQTVVSAAALLPARCAARWSEGKASSLVLSGRDGLPPDPSGVLPSPLVLEERLVADPAVTGAPHRQTSPARFAFLADAEKVWPRLRGVPRDFGCTP